jgi:hypothetical protein
MLTFLEGKKKMKIAAIAATAMVVASSASAIELGNTGVSLGGKVDMNYTTGLDTYAVDFIPRASYSAFGVGFGVETTFDVMGLNDDEVFKGIDLDASYEIMPGLEAYGEVGTDADFEFGDVKMGVTFAF